MNVYIFKTYIYMYKLIDIILFANIIYMMLLFVWSIVVLYGYKWCIIVILFISHMMLLVVWYIGCVAVWYDMMAGYYACTHVPQLVSMPIWFVVLTLCVYAWCILGCIHRSEYLCVYVYCRMQCVYVCSVCVCVCVCVYDDCVFSIFA